MAIDEAFFYLPFNMILEDEIDIGRGDMIVRENNIPELGQDLEVVTWIKLDAAVTNR